MAALAKNVNTVGNSFQTVVNKNVNQVSQTLQNGASEITPRVETNTDIMLEFEAGKKDLNSFVGTQDLVSYSTPAEYS